MTGAQPLVTLLPRDSALQAHLYAPSRAVGFIEPGQIVTDVMQDTRRLIEWVFEPLVSHKGKV